MNGDIDVNNETLEFIRNYEYEPNEGIRFTSIILLSYNKLDYTRLCIESIRKFTPKDHYEIIVVDNNSEEETVNWLKDQDDLKVIYNDYNAGFPKGCNQGIEISKGESILLLNNDTIVTPNWLNNLDRALYNSEKTGAVGAITNSCSNGQAIGVTYKDIGEMIKFSYLIESLNEKSYEYKLNLIGYCYLIKKEVLDKVGLLDEIFTPGNYEDNDLSYRILSSGYDLILARDTFIHHFGSVSFGANPQNYNSTIITNFYKFNEKWGFNVDKSLAMRADLANLMTSNSDDNINVLEIGCGVGGTLIEFRNRYKNANIYAIEKNKNSGNVAKGFANVIIADVEEIDLPYEKKYFDYIILGDVLEELRDPWKALKILKEYLKDDGYILASIRNIMHISAIRQILTGSFPYSDSGILEKDNLRFFAGYDIQKMFLENGYKINTIYQQRTNVTQDEEEFINKLCQITGEAYRLQYLTSNYILKASKAN